ncbi:xanthine dehydrogenase/oxidase-like isoform X2 [Mya arenaria]|uniref:xanthine dehydrogenase/oxidase-like isoform X2 n=1 Tax=Mya arenaria TaxID=6604 RepID=UPI0022E059E8|nr:xanthine dehydrogenase/oxidase-like isoform X2 [Mya arenaria]
MASTGQTSTTVNCPVCGTSHVPVSSCANGVQAATCVSCGHFFKFRAVEPLKSTITLTVNGKQYTVGNEYGPSSALNGFLRDQRISVGTKHMCYQGGCGTCLVEAKLFEPLSENSLSYAVNSCLVPLYSCDGWEIRTVDYIGNLKKGLHPIQTQIANYNGSQCGYCTPGQVMNMFALTEFYGDTLTKKQVEDSFDGVICRCTGYRPILAAFKNMAKGRSKCSSSTVGDIEDFKTKVCKKSGKSCSGRCSSVSEPLTHLVFADSQWFRPNTEQQITDILNANKGKKIRFLLGNTAHGVYSDQSPDNYDVIMDLTSFREMYDISFDTDIVLGGGLTLTMLVDIFTRMTQEAPYFGECANLLKRIANLPVRNRATWSGNLMLKYVHRDFPSDILVLLQVLRARIWTDFDGNDVSISDFLSTDLTGKLVFMFSYTELDDVDHIKFYKVTPRVQNAHCYVTGGFRVRMDKGSFVLKETPVIAYSGIGAQFDRAIKTEAYLNGKNIADATVLKTALSTLAGEIKADSSPVLSSATYRTNLALALFYKFVLNLVGVEAGLPYRSGASELYWTRPISSGVQTYDTVPVEYPVTQPLKKLEANAQATGEAEYVDDMPAYPGQLEAAFVLSTVGSATIQNIDSSEALKMPGVIRVITAKDIVGTNNWFLPGPPAREMLASQKVEYCGQPVAIVLAADYGTALGAVYAVKVTYSGVTKPVLSLDDAIQQKSFFPKQCDDLVVGDPDGAIAQSAKKLSGTISMGHQYHFHMETQASVCVPKEDGMDVYTTTQWIDFAQSSISQVTGMLKSSINVQVKRLGGAYGAKITQNNWIAAACGLSAFLTNRPVKLRLTLGDNMKMLGKRYPFRADYQAGFTDAGQLNAVKVTYYADCGVSANDNSLPSMQTWANNAYACNNWSIDCVAVKTNTPANTAARSPGSLPAIFIMETIMEHVAKTVDKDPTDVRILNLFSNGAVDPLTKMPLTDCQLQTQVPGLMSSVGYADRKTAVEDFNKTNRWKKKGLSVVPLKFGIDWRGVRYGSQVAIFWPDGTIAITHGGIELGQGVNTKAAQVCAYELGVPIDLIKVKATNSNTTANSITTGGSITSENVCAGVIECCKVLNARLAPVKAKLPDPTWPNVIEKCYQDGIDLTSRYWRNPAQSTPFQYYSYGATVTEVDFDVLTGEHTIARVDILFDCGQSTNPALDVGQVEGAFVMGLGYWLTEQLRFDPETGALVTDSTWEYKPPSSKDIPVDFRVNLVKKNPNPAGILGAKAVGEPPLCMSCSALFAIKHAIQAARKDIGKDDTYFPLNGPATPEMCQLAFLTDPSQFTLTVTR